ncbi:MAG TPA: hypothetical protein VJL31_00465 [Gemmatimonadales bacterium]|nr:hypothetical protein [Gemmatimonadales bacterium]
MSRLHEIQQALAASLARGGPCPPQCDPEEVARAARALEAKRRRAAAHLLPHARHTLGESWRARFHEHAATYTPAGMLYHVDDAWELAERAARSRSPALCRAARRDLAALRRRYVRSRRRRIDRIRERRGLIELVRSWLRGSPGR